MDWYGPDACRIAFPTVRLPFFSAGSVFEVIFGWARRSAEASSRTLGAIRYHRCWWSASVSPKKRPSSTPPGGSTVSGTKRWPLLMPGVEARSSRECVSRYCPFPALGPTTLCGDSRRATGDRSPLRTLGRATGEGWLPPPPSSLTIALQQQSNERVPKGHRPGRRPVSSLPARSERGRSRCNAASMRARDDRRHRPPVRGACKRGSRARR